MLDHSPDRPPSQASRRLASWKEIAGYLGRTVRTVQRWEREQALPVHRLPHNRQASVYAYTRELDDWWEQRRQSLGPDGTATTPPPPTARVSAAAPASRRRGVRAAAAAAAVLIAVSALGVWWTARTRAPTAIRSIALLPLAATGSSEAALAAEGLADELARHLARVRSVRVLGAASNARVLGDARDVRQIASTLQVDAVLRGDVRSTRDGIEAALQLVDGASGATLWQGSYRGPLQPTSTSPGAAAALLGDLFRQVWPGEPAPAAPVQSPQAYFAYLRGRSQLARRNAEALRAAADEFARTIALEPRFAEAHAGLADAYLLMGIFGALDPAVAFPKAKESARAALALNAQSADAHTSLAFATELLDHDWPAAETHFRAAIAANPSHASAHHWYALLLDSMLRGDEAIREMETARALAPLSVNINSDLGMVLAHQGRAADAIAQFARTLAIDPSYVDAHSELGWAYREAGEYDRAIDSFRRAGELGAHPAQVAVNVLVCHARAGRHEQVRQILKRLQTPGTFAAPVPPALLAQALIAAGDHDRGLDLLLADPFAADVNLLVGTIYRPLWNDPRFEALVRRNGLLEPFTAYKRAQRGTPRLPPERANAAAQ